MHKPTHVPHARPSILPVCCPKTCEGFSSDGAGFISSKHLLSGGILWKWFGRFLHLQKAPPPAASHIAPCISRLCGPWPRQQPSDELLGHFVQRPRGHRRSPRRRTKRSDQASDPSETRDHSENRCLMRFASNTTQRTRRGKVGTKMSLTLGLQRKDLKKYWKNKHQKATKSRIWNSHQEIIPPKDPKKMTPKKWLEVGTKKHPTSPGLPKLARHSRTTSNGSWKLEPHMKKKSPHEAGACFTLFFTKKKSVLTFLFSNWSWWGTNDHFIPLLTIPSEATQPCVQTRYHHGCCRLLS